MLQETDEDRRKKTRNKEKNKNQANVPRYKTPRDPLHMIEDRNVNDSPQTKLNVKPFSFANTILAELLLCDKNRKKSFSLNDFHELDKTEPFLTALPSWSQTFSFCQTRVDSLLKRQYQGWTQRTLRRHGQDPGRLEGLVWLLFISLGYCGWVWFLFFYTLLDIIVWLYYGLVWFNASSLNAPTSLFLLTDRKVGNHQVLHALKCLFVRCKRKEECQWFSLGKGRKLALL